MFSTFFTSLDVSVAVELRFAARTDWDLCGSHVLSSPVTIAGLKGWQVCAALRCSVVSPSSQPHGL